MTIDVKSLNLALADSGVSEAIEAWKRERIALSPILADIARLGASDTVSAAIRNLNGIADEHRRLASGITSFTSMSEAMGVGSHLATMDLPSMSKLAGELALGTSQLRLMGQFPDTTAIGKALNPTLFSLVSDLGQVSFTEHWQGYLRSFVDVPNFTGFTDAIGAASRIASVNFSSVDYASLFGNGGSDATASGLLTATSRYARRGARYAQSAEVGEIEPELRSLPHDGLAAHSAILRELTSEDFEVDDETEHETFLLEHLPKLDLALATNYRGMKAAQRRRDIDWSSHVAISGRKLVEGVLNKIAPHTVVIPWAQTNKHEIRSPREATRLTQIRWVCSNISNGDYAQVVFAEMRAGVKVMTYFNDVVHGSGNPKLQERSRLVIQDAEQLVRHLLSIWLIRG